MKKEPYPFEDFRKMFLGDWRKPDYKPTITKRETTICELCGEEMFVDECMPYSNEHCPQYDCHEGCYDQSRYRP